MKKILVVVDMQNDFLTGTLANESAVSIIPNIKNEIESNNYNYVIFTRDTHYNDYMQTQEGKRLPVIHCLNGSYGWQICDELETAKTTSPFFFINKPTFGYADWKEFFESISDEKDVEINFTGTCTDICVVSNALAIKAALPEATVRCLANCCAPLMGDQAKQDAALSVMESCQIDVIK